VRSRHSATCSVRAAGPRYDSFRKAAGCTFRQMCKAAVKRFMGVSPHSCISHSPAAFARTRCTRGAQRLFTSDSGGDTPPTFLCNRASCHFVFSGLEAKGGVSTRPPFLNWPTRYLGSFGRLSCSLSAWLPRS